MKIVSLVPSLTELLFFLGLGDQVVGRTKFCIHPSPALSSVTKVGGTKTIHTEIVESLKPDLIIANKEENTKEAIEVLQQNHTVLLTQISNFEEALEAILIIGNATHTAQAANQLVHDIRDKFSALTVPSSRSVCYLIWQKPYMTIGNDTFIHDMLLRSGFENIFGDRKRYPQLEIQELQEKNPEFVFLSSEPFPFKQKHIDELKVHLPDTEIRLVDGELFSWYGNRMLDAADYFQTLI